MTKEELTKEEKERILKCVMNQIEQEQQQKAPRRRIHPRRAAAAALAAATIFVCGAFTAKVLELDSGLVHMLGGSNEQLTEAVTDIGAAVEKNGLRLEVKQAVGDGHRVYAIFELTSLTDLKLDETCGFENYEADWPEKDYGSSGIGIDSEINSVSGDGKTLRFGVEFILDQQVYDQNVVMHFENFGRVFYIPDNEAEVLIKGVWTIDFPLKYKNISKTYNMNAAVPAGKGTLKLERVDLSPMSCFLDFGVETYSKELEEYWSERTHVKVRMKDGRLISFKESDATWIDAGKGSSGSLEGAFARPLDMEQVDSLIVNGKRIPLE